MKFQFELPDASIESYATSGAAVPPAPDCAKETRSTVSEATLSTSMIHWVGDPVSLRIVSSCPATFPPINSTKDNPLMSTKDPAANLTSEPAPSILQVPFDTFTPF